MSDWTIEVPYRARSQKIEDALMGLRALGDPEERAVARELLVAIHVSGGRTMGQVLDVVEGLDAADRRLFLDGCRKAAGLRTATEIDNRAAYERANTTVRGNPFLQRCAHCDVVPLTESGSLAETKVRRWHCAEHAYLAQPGDLEDRPPPWRYSPSGAIVEVNEAEEAREAATAESRRREREEQAAERAVDAEEYRKHKQAIADETRRLVPLGVWA